MADNAKLNLSASSRVVGRNTSGAGVSEELTIAQLLAWGAGTSFPVSPATNERFFRTDRSIEYFYNGTRWLSTALYEARFGSVGITATSTYWQALQYPESTDKWLENIFVSAAPQSGGTALDASNMWVCSLNKFGTGGTIAGINANVLTLDSGVSDASYRSPTTAAIGALLGTTYAGLRVTWTKTGTPGNLNGFSVVTYRLVG